MSDKKTGGEKRELNKRSDSAQDEKPAAPTTVEGVRKKREAAVSAAESIRQSVSSPLPPPDNKGGESNQSSSKSKSKSEADSDEKAMRKARKRALLPSMEDVSQRNFFPLKGLHS